MKSAVQYHLQDFFTNIYRHFMYDSLRRNSSFLLGSSAIGALFGFFFWILCTHFTATTQVGYAASLLAYVSLFSNITTLGLPNAVIRFLPQHKNKDRYFGTVLAATITSSLIFGALLIYAIRFFSPKLHFVVASPEIYSLLLIILLVSSVGNVADAALLAHKDAGHVFMKAVWQSPLKVLLPLALATLDLKSILAIYALSACIGTIYEMVVLYRKHHKRASLQLSSLRDTYRFTTGNLLGALFGVFPASLVPIIVLNRLGAAQAAYFYIALQFAGLLSLISGSSAQAYLAEAANDPEANYMQHLVKALKNLYSLLIPSALIMAIVGTQALRFYGAGYYAHAAVPLVLLCAASLLVGINWLGDSLLNVQKRPLAYGAMNLVNAVLVVVAVRFVASKGLTAVGFGWLLAQAMTVVIYVILQRKFMRTYVSVSLA